MYKKHHPVCVCGSITRRTKLIHTHTHYYGSFPFPLCRLAAFNFCIYCARPIQRKRASSHQRRRRRECAAVFYVYSRKMYNNRRPHRNSGTIHIFTKKKSFCPIQSVNLNSAIDHPFKKRLECGAAYK